MQKVAVINYALIRDHIPRGQMKELAKAMGLNAVTLSRKLNESRKLYVDELNVIAHYLGTSISEFLHEEERTPPNKNSES